jgi:hypothetical protein
MEFSDIHSIRQPYTEGVIKWKRKGASMADPKKQLAYQLKVTLRYSKPPIWRRLVVRGNATLGELHDVLQIAMGWTNSHLHQFRVGEEYYGTPHPEWDADVRDETKAQLSRVAPSEKFKFVYDYDFGDGWEHEVVVKKITAAAANMPLAVCVTGKGACPPEDCGGIWGYMNLLEVMQDPDHPDHEDLMEWLEDEFDPKAFDVAEVNSELEGLQ